MASGKAQHYVVEWGLQGIMGVGNLRAGKVLWIHVSHASDEGSHHAGGSRTC